MSVPVNLSKNLEIIRRAECGKDPAEIGCALMFATSTVHRIINGATSIKELVVLRITGFCDNIKESKESVL